MLASRRLCRFLLVALSFVLLAVPARWAQAQEQSVNLDRYYVNPKHALQDTAYYQRPVGQRVLRAGDLLTETVGDRTFTRRLTADTVLTVMEEVAVTLRRTWRASEVKYTSADPGRLHLNPWPFVNPEDAALNDAFYLKVPENGAVTLRRSHVKWSAITIPVVIRPALNDTLGSRITTNLKAGISLSWNHNWESFRNRRLQAKKRTYGYALGLAGGLSRVYLDPTTTRLAAEPVAIEEYGLAAFVAPGLAVNLSGVQVGAFLGYDYGLTENARRWDYHRRWFYGLALGIGLDIFGARL